MQNITDFKLNSKVLFDKIEAIKKNPPQEVLEFKAAHPEYKTVNCALLAEFIGLSEKTLTNLKLGKLTDSNCSTVWLICNSLGIDLRDYFGIPRQSECNPDTCSSHAQARLDEKRQRIAELESLCKESDRKLINLNCIIREQCEALGESKAKASGLEASLSEKKKDVEIRNRIILGLASAVLVTAVAFVCLLWISVCP